MRLLPRPGRSRPVASGAGAISPRLRLGVLLALVPVVGYSAACLVYNAPPSPARNRVASVASAVMEPYFWQDWQLFGPTPGSDVNLLYLDAQVRLPSGAVVQTSPVEIEDTIDRSPRKFRINPTKLPGILLALDEGAQHYDQVATNIRKLPAGQRAKAQRDLDQAFAPNFLELQRFLSSRAASLYPGGQILSVRATFKIRPIVPFSARYASPQPVEKTKALLQTSWLDYVPGVAQ